VVRAPRRSPGRGQQIEHKKRIRSRGCVFDKLCELKAGEGAREQDAREHRVGIDGIGAGNAEAARQASDEVTIKAIAAIEDAQRMSLSRNGGERREQGAGGSAAGASARA
jgi:hypothetical protein